MNSNDWKDSEESIGKILLLAPPKDREMYKKMLFNIFKNEKTTSTRKASQISTIMRILTTKENFERLMKESKKDFIRVFELISSSIGPNEFRMLLKSAYFKLKKKAGR